MTKIALFGAGGKMGLRLSKNLLGSPYQVRHVEPGAVGRQRLHDELGLDCVAVDTALVEGYSGRLCDLVAEQAREWGADLVVLGSHGRRGIGRVVLGSDAEQIIRSAHLPVLVVREPDQDRISRR